MALICAEGFIKDFFVETEIRDGRWRRLRFGSLGGRWEKRHQIVEDVIAIDY
jgi:hypothetical protein